MRHYSAETMADFHMVVKRFQKFVRYGDTDRETPYPDEVRWLRKNVKESERRAPLFFTDQEVEAMIRAADKLRDKAFIATYGEMGGRPSEFLLLRIGDLTFDDNGVVVQIRQGKTGWRTLRLISSAAYLADHISTHPYRSDPNAPLWLTTSTNHLNQPMSWLAADKLVKEAGSKAGIRKGRCHMYMFRHGSATRNARFLTDAEMRLMFGWSPSSKVPGRYVHLSGGDLDQKYQQVYGSGRPVEPPKPSSRPVVCPRCQEKGSPGMRFCPKCATPLEQEERARAAAEEAVTRQEMTELRKLVERSLKTENPSSFRRRARILSRSDLLITTSSSPSELPSCSDFAVAGEEEDCCMTVWLGWTFNGGSGVAGRPLYADCQGRPRPGTGHPLTTTAIFSSSSAIARRSIAAAAESPSAWYIASWLKCSAIGTL